MKKEKMPQYIKCYLSLKDKQIIKHKAKELGISASNFIKLSALSKPLPDPSRQHAILELSKINADIARLGNLQRAVIDKNQQLPPDVIEQIRLLSGQLKDKINEL